MSSPQRSPPPPYKLSHLPPDDTDAPSNSPPYTTYLPSQTDDAISVQRIQDILCVTGLVIFILCLIAVWYIGMTSGLTQWIFVFISGYGFCSVCWKVFVRRIYWEYFRRTAGEDEEMALMDEDDTLLDGYEELRDDDDDFGRGRSVERRV
jgi:hypothetical protein